MATGDATVRLSRFTESTTPEAEIPMQIGSVRLVREIGRGGMGVVWLARHEILGRDVAVKFVLSAAGAATTNENAAEAREPMPSPPDAKTTPIPDAKTAERDAPAGGGAGADLPGNEMQAFIEGCRAAAAVRHPGLVEVYHADIVNRIPYLVMEYVDGPSLEGAIRRLGALSVPVALAIMEVTCDAVASLHDAGIIHRDIKPANLLITPEGQIEVTDFGLACERPAGKGHESVGLAGTPAYMAPEMFDGSISLKSDVYALGITLFEMLTGTVPYDGNLTTLQNHHRASELPIDLLKIKQVPAAIIEVIERATAKNPMLRSRTARHVVQALKLAVRDEKVWAQGKRELSTLVSRWRSAAVDEAREGASSQAQGTYYDHLSMRAERKRKFTPAPLEPGIEPLTPLSPSDDEDSLPSGRGSGTFADRPGQAEVTGAAKVPMQRDISPTTSGTGAVAAPEPGGTASATSSAPIVQGRLTQHICCTQCDYDLFALPESAACPECATPILSSMSAERLVFADRAWLDRVQRGLGVSLVAIAIAPILMLVSSIPGAFEPAPGAVRLLGLIELLGIAISTGLLTWAGFRCTPSEPGPIKHASIVARFVTRFGLVISCCVIAAETADRAISGIPPFGTTTNAGGGAATIIGIAMVFGWIVAACGFVAYLTSILHTIPNAAISRWSKPLYAVATVSALVMPLASWAMSGDRTMSGALLILIMLMLLVALSLPCGMLAYAWACRRSVQRVIDPVTHSAQRRKPKFDDE
jgi:serine/threonine protein kinase